MKKYSLSQWHWFGQKCSEHFKTWESLLESTYFQEFKNRKEISDYEMEFIESGFKGNPYQAIHREFMFPFGKHKGRKLEDIPDKALQWYLEQDWIEKWGNLSLVIQEYLKEKSIDKPTKDDIKSILSLE